MVSLFLILNQILFGINFVTSKIVVTAIPPYSFTAIRFLISGLILSIWLLYRRYVKKIETTRKGHKIWLKVIVLALLGVTLSQTLFVTGLKYTTSINTSIISTTIPLFTLLISWIRKQIAITWYTMIGFILALIGVLFLKDLEEFSLSNISFIGDILIILSCLFLATFISYSKDLFKIVDPAWGTTFIFLIGGAVLLPLTLTETSVLPSFTMNGSFYPSLAFSILGATLTTYFINNWALTKVDPARVALFIYLQPVVAAIFAWKFLGENISWREVVSILLILIGMKLALKK